MNRSTFITTAGSSAALAGISGSRILSGQTPSAGLNSQVYQYSNFTHAFAAGQGLYSPHNGNNWQACGKAMSAVVQDWQANQYDNAVKAAAASITLDQVISANLEQDLIL